MHSLKRLAGFLPTSIRDPITHAWRNARGAPDIHLLRIMADRSKIALDIGANAGDYAIDMVRHSKRVEAYEPVPELAQSIKEKLKALNINVYPWALSDKTGTVTLRIPVIRDGENPANASVEPGDKSLGLATRDVEVPSYRIDDLNLDPVGVIKMDAEGHEAAILDGATQLFERDQPNILMEADDTRHHAGCVVAARIFFAARGYTGFFMMGRQLVPIAEFDFSKHQNPDSLDANKHVIFGRLYVDSFAFVRQPKMVALLTDMAERGVTL
jgi:FkbM family methyltransferase